MFNMAKRKRETVKKIDRKFLNSIQVPTQNRFKTLDNAEMDTDQTEKEKKLIISPIVITDFQTDLSAVFQPTNVTCNIKLTSVGRKIFPATVEDKTKIIEVLKAKQMDHFTHPDNDSKLFKVILSGLPAIDTAVIGTSINDQIKVQPTKIIMFESKSTNKLYLLHFNASQVNFKTLQDIKYVHHHVIKWSKYKPKRKGPTQCYRCLMYGHGISQCSRYAACMLCAGNHLTSTCLTHQNKPNAIFKCYNCLSAKLQDNHKANDIACPFRQKYEEARNNARNKAQPNQRTQPSTAENSTAVQSTKSGPTYAERLRGATSATSRRQSNVSVSHTNNGGQSSSTQFNFSNANVGNNIWSISECTNIIFNSVEKLQKCKTKLEQLQIITELLQHACT